MKTLLSGVAALAASGLVLTGLALASGGPEPTAPASTLAAYSVDVGHSSVVFKTKHVGVAEFFGRFNKVDGEVVYDSEKPTDSKVTIEIPVDSIDTNSAQRDGHLKSADFFSAKEFPKLTFESKSVAMDGDTMLVTGDLTVRDTTKEVVANVVKIGEGEAMRAYRAGFTAHFEIDMTEFGFQFVEQNPGALGPEVEIWVALELTRD